MIRILKIFFIGIVIILFFLKPELAVYAIIGFIIGILLGYILSKLKPYWERLDPISIWKRLNWETIKTILLFALLTIILGPGMLLLREKWPPFPQFAGYTEGIFYTIHIEYDRYQNNWEIEDEILIPKESTFLIQEKLQSQEKLEIEPIKVEENVYIEINDKFIKITRKRKEKVTSFLFVGETVNVIPMIDNVDALLGEYLETHFNFFYANGSEIILEVPNNMISITYPELADRVNLLKGNKERITIPIGTLREEKPELRIAVINPLLRKNTVVDLLRSSVWNVIYYIILLICAIFNDQIKNQILIPTVRRIFSKLNIPFKNNINVLS